MKTARLPSRSTQKLFVIFALLVSLLANVSAQSEPSTRLDSPPDQPVRLVFIHHSTGGNWLADPNPDQPGGGLGRALMENNYFVSATNYGWGPDSIGDRTDIVNWPEWFTGPHHDAIMQAVYNEDEQNIGDFGSWPRPSVNPGGENQIIIFKSCFPNSDLWGTPNDGPLSAPNEDYTVANAKAVYNAILSYFQTRQDKLFIVITAPPMAQGEYSSDDLSPEQRAANARAFNNWLVNDWLSDYPYNNVAVFDYYNVLTSNGSSDRLDDTNSNTEPNDEGWDDGNHHRWWNGDIQHIRTVANDFSAYPTSSDGDSHPTSQGQQKATLEFVTLLNVYYNLWQASGPPPSPGDAEDSGSQDTTPPQENGPGSPATVASLIDDMEGENLWESYPDDMGSIVESSLTDQEAYSGSQSLRIEVDITEGGWGDTGRYFEELQNWSSSDGLDFWLHADQAGLPFSLILFSGNPESPTPFNLELVTSPDSTAGWVQYTLSWDEFSRAVWADPTGLTELDTHRISGLSINHISGQGTLRLDDVGLWTYSNSDEDQQPDPTNQADDGAGICPLGMLLPGILLAAAWIAGRPQS